VRKRTFDKRVLLRIEHLRHVRWVQAAEREGLTMNGWMLRHLDSAATPVRGPVSSLEDLYRDGVITYEDLQKASGRVV
jgi:hypothetical protein